MKISGGAVIDVATKKMFVILVGKYFMTNMSCLMKFTNDVCPKTLTYFTVFDSKYNNDEISIKI